MDREEGEMRSVKIDELQRGDLIMVRWDDASDLKGTLEEHEGAPDLACKDWGIFLGVSGEKRRFVLIGKDVVEGQNEWGVTRIPLELVEEVVLIIPREDVAKVVKEVQALGRRIRTRKYSRVGVERVIIT